MLYDAICYIEFKRELDNERTLEEGNLFYDALSLAMYNMYNHVCIHDT